MPSPMFEMKLEFNSNPLLTNVIRLDDRIDSQVHAVFEYQATKAESFMKTTAPWTDQTGNARAGLGTKVGWNRGESHSILLFHRMNYGIFLETRWAGKFAIILPTIQIFGPGTMKLLDKLFRRLGVAGGMP